uniref:Uncharacterized protein n=1 Tax=Candidatus Kentrum sp. SD TaxID=2126332 RepID=A0A450YUM1_9GAMM|nr:MAG: hypothetical protein BECKSD772F_GA0070984_10524 [Candidatus Kentron sp. SD]VFK45205.1 MAG: hypothetical protein BECKSD772E_GA0070983_10504 [Candidatus Kentron sp. SD]
MKILSVMKLIFAEHSEIFRCYRMPYQRGQFAEFFGFGGQGCLVFDFDEPKFPKKAGQKMEF